MSGIKTTREIAPRKIISGLPVGGDKESSGGADFPKTPMIAPPSNTAPQAEENPLGRG